MLKQTPLSVTDVRQMIRLNHLRRAWFPLQLTLPQMLPYLLIAAALVGGAASFMLTYDKIHLLQNPEYHPACNINPILSCGSVMKTPQANLLGVPNTIFGLVAFSMLLTFGSMLAAGAQVSKRIWVVAQLAATTGVIFMHYLFFQAVFRIHAICPWCFAVWIVTIPVFWYVTQWNLRSLSLTKMPALRGTVSFVIRHHADLLIVWYAIIFAIILQRFWYFWSSLV